MPLTTSLDFFARPSPSSLPRLEIFRHEGIDSYAPIPPFFGEGNIHTMKLGPEMGFMVTTHTPNAESIRETVKVEVRDDGPFVKFMAILETAPTTMRISGDPKAIQVTAPSLSVASPDITLCYADVPYASYRAVVLLLGMERLAESWESIAAPGLPERLAFLAGEKTDEPQLETISFELELNRLFRKVVDCPFSAAVRRLYLEGLGLEIAGLTLSSLSQGGCVESSGLRPRDARRMEKAREWLECDLAEPPSMEEMAKNLGISASKFKRDFKAFTGASVHAYLLGRRLERAEVLLSRGELSVKEASYAVGFHSQSYFSQVFRQRYGRSPSEKRY